VVIPFFTKTKTLKSIPASREGRRDAALRREGATVHIEGYMGTIYSTCDILAFYAMIESNEESEQGDSQFHYHTH